MPREPEETADRDEEGASRSPAAAAGPGGLDRQRLKSRVQDLVRDVEARAAESPRRRVRVPLFLWRVSVQVVRQWARDRCPQQAASLSFQSLLSLVPALAVCLAALRATGQLEAKSALVSVLAERLIPVSPREIAQRLAEWSENVTFESVGLIGLISTVVLAFIMFNSLERVINFVWRVERRRPITQKFVVFYATATIGPFLIGISVVQAAELGLTRGIAGYALSFLTLYLAVFLANFFLPAIKVRAGPVAVGALLTTAAIEAAKHLFNFYVTSYAFSQYAGIYGAVAIAPLLMIWIYWFWLMLLLGAEFSHAAQNVQYLERVDRRGEASLEDEILRRINGPMAARVMVAAAEAYTGGEKVLTRQQIADRFDVSDEVLDRLTERLKAADLLMEMKGEHAGFLPARPPQEITLAEVLSAFRAEDADVARPRGDTALDRVLAELDEDALSRTRELPLSELSARRAPSGVRGSS